MDNQLHNISEINSIDDMYNENLDCNMNIIPINNFNNKCHDRMFDICCNDNYMIQDFKILYDIIMSLNLSNLEKNLILVRFRRINLFCIKNYKSISNYYTKSKIFIIICGILNPSLLSINDCSNDYYYVTLFWIIWGLQLSVSLITSFISFYKWDKKYFLYSSYKSKINQEIWLYLELTGRYSSIIDSDTKEIIFESSHKNKFHMFMERIEYLLKKLKNFNLEIETNDEDKENNYIRKYSKNNNNIINNDDSPESNLNDSPDGESSKNINNETPTNDNKV